MRTSDQRAAADNSALHLRDKVDGIGLVVALEVRRLDRQSGTQDAMAQVDEFLNGRTTHDEIIPVHARLIPSNDVMTSAA